MGDTRLNIPARFFPYYFWSTLKDGEFEIVTESFALRFERFKHTPRLHG